MLRRMKRLDVTPIAWVSWTVWLPGAKPPLLKVWMVVQFAKIAAGLPYRCRWTSVATPSKTSGSNVRWNHR